MEKENSIPPSPDSGRPTNKAAGPEGGLHQELARLADKAMEELGAVAEGVNRLKAGDQKFIGEVKRPAAGLSKLVGNADPKEKDYRPVQSAGEEHLPRIRSALNQLEEEAGCFGQKLAPEEREIKDLLDRLIKETDRQTINKISSEVVFVFGRAVSRLQENRLDANKIRQRLPRITEENQTAANRIYRHLAQKLSRPQESLSSQYLIASKKLNKIISEEVAKLSPKEKRFLEENDAHFQRFIDLVKKMVAKKFPQQEKPREAGES